MKTPEQLRVEWAAASPAIKAEFANSVDNYIAYFTGPAFQARAARERIGYMWLAVAAAVVLIAPGWFKLAGLMPLQIGAREFHL